jgi:hypothetical protein
VSNAKRLKPRLPDADELAFKAELAKGCPGCGSRTVKGQFRGVWEWTLLCKPGCPSFTGAVDGFTGHSIGAAAAARSGMTYRAIDGSTGGVVVAAQPG